MRNGARDVLLKKEIARLVPAIQRELKAARERDSHRKSRRLLKEVEDKHKAMVQGSREAISYCHEGMHIDANKAYLDIFGYDNTEELSGIPILNLIKKDGHARFKEYMRKGLKGSDKDINNEFEAIKKDGSSFYAEITQSEIDHNGERCIQFIVSDISKRKAVEKKLQYMNQRDPLTGVYNRHYFIQELGKAVEQAKTGGNPSGLLFLDLNQLKSINESVGHAAGDRLLLMITRLFREKLDDDTIISRFSGDEFAILLKNKDEKVSKKIAADISKSLKDATFTESGKKFKCGCTLGTTIIDEAAENAHEVLSLAYKACAKNKPRKQVQAQVNQANEQPRGITPVTKNQPDDYWREQIDTALGNNAFQLVFQPIINLHSEPAEYYEVLVRLTTKQGGLVSAAEFMPTAEATGQILAIDKWVIGNALQVLADLYGEGQSATFFINISAHSLANSTILKQIEGLLQTHSLSGKAVVFEADEAALNADPIATGEFIRKIHELDCEFCLDDFGKIGDYQLLKQHAIEYIKIAGSIIHDLNIDTINQAVLKSIMLIAEALGKKTIAKYVEDAEILALLWDQKIDYVMGNYFQQADVDLAYDFSAEAGETTLSSDIPNEPSWLSQQ